MSNKKGQPVLVGTISIETSEMLSGVLRRHGIKHNVLNAKYQKKLKLSLRQVIRRYFHNWQPWLYMLVVIRV